MIMVVARYMSRRALALRPVNSVKKVIDSTGALAASTVTTVTIANSLAAVAWTDGGDNNIPQYSNLYGVYLSLYCTLDGAPDASVPEISWYISKNPGNNLTMPEPSLTGGNDNRRWILHEGKGLLSFDTVGQPRLLFEGVIKIPKKMQRFSLDDTLDVRILSENHNGFFCLKSIYKFFR